LCKKGIDLKEPIVIGQEYELEDYDETTILFYAIRNYASIEAIEILLEYGVDINEIDEDGLSAIDVAIKFKREDVVKLCIDRGMDINKTYRKSGINPIILASCFNNISMVELLLENGADINSGDISGMSAKDYARKLGQKKMLEFLDSKGTKHNIYKEEVKIIEEKPKFDMTNREKPSDDMGFDSI
ncbi:MAG: ankyrin repeat domain-containing protein, partial [Sulfurovaceae bacterium]|nr:ankyrin repeat domain-containing protein [Sulfurovaceae bacterium]